MCVSLQIDEDVLKINVMAVQQQKNSVDCGIFAMEFLTCILFDEDLKTQRFPTTENNVEKGKCKFVSQEL